MGNNERADAKQTSKYRTKSPQFRAGTRANKKTRTVKTFLSDRGKKK